MRAPGTGTLSHDSASHAAREGGGDSRLERAIRRPDAQGQREVEPRSGAMRVLAHGDQQVLARDLRFEVGGVTSCAKWRLPVVCRAPNVKGEKTTALDLRFGKTVHSLQRLQRGKQARD